MPVGVVTELVEGDVYHWGVADGGRAARLAAGGGALLVLRRVLRLRPDRRGEGVEAAASPPPAAHSRCRRHARRCVRITLFVDGANPMSIQDKIRDQVTANRVVLYMKGTPQFPQCGFSATAVEILKRCGVTDYLAVDVLQDPEIRQGIKDYANWPTIPAALRERRVRRRLRHPAGDVPGGRAAAAPRQAAGLSSAGSRRAGARAVPRRGIRTSRMIPSDDRALRACAHGAGRMRRCVRAAVRASVAGARRHGIRGGRRVRRRESRAGAVRRCQRRRRLPPLAAKPVRRARRSLGQHAAASSTGRSSRSACRCSACRRRSARRRARTGSPRCSSAAAKGGSPSTGAPRQHRQGRRQRSRSSSRNDDVDPVAGETLTTRDRRRRRRAGTRDRRDARGARRAA